MPEIALIVALHGGHVGGPDFGWIWPMAISLMMIVVLAISSRRPGGRVREKHSARQRAGPRQVKLCLDSPGELLVGLEMYPPWEDQKWRVASD